MSATAGLLVTALPAIAVVHNLSQAAPTQNNCDKTTLPKSGDNCVYTNIQGAYNTELSCRISPSSSQQHLETDSGKSSCSPALLDCSFDSGIVVVGGANGTLKGAEGGGGLTEIPMVDKQAAGAASAAKTAKDVQSNEKGAVASSGDVSGTVIGTGISCNAEAQMRQKLRYERLQQWRLILLELDRQRDPYRRLRERLSKICDRRISKKGAANEKICNVCCCQIDQVDFKSVVTCCVCNKKICRGAKCSTWLPKVARWECQLCQSSKESLTHTQSWVAEQMSFNRQKYVYPMRARSEIYIPIGDCNESSMHFESVSQVGESSAAITAEQKLKIREYVEEVVASLLGDSLDQIRVGQLSRSENYLHLFEKYHSKLSNIFISWENELSNKALSGDLPGILNNSASPQPQPSLALNGNQCSNSKNAIKKPSEFSEISQTRLRYMIESIIAETLRMPPLANGSASEVALNTHARSNGAIDKLPLENGNLRLRHRPRTDHYFEPKIYQDLLATAVLNKIADKEGNLRQLSESTPDLSSRNIDANFNVENQSTSSGSSVEPRSDFSYTDTEQPPKINKIFIGGRESALSDYIAGHTVPLPDLSAAVTESEEDDHASVSSSTLAEGTWEDNWLFRKKRSSLTTSMTGSVGMLVPAPKDDVRAQIGDKTTDEISDLSEMGSDTDDSSLKIAGANLDQLNDRILNKHLIGGQNTKLVLDELIETASLISNTPNAPNEPEYHETRNEHVGVALKTEAINPSIAHHTAKAAEVDQSPLSAPMQTDDDIIEEIGCTGYSVDDMFDEIPSVGKCIPTPQGPSVIEILAAMALGPMLAIPTSEQSSILTSTEMTSLKELSDIALAEIKSRGPEIKQYSLDIIDEEEEINVVNAPENDENENDVSCVTIPMVGAVEKNSTSAEINANIEDMEVSKSIKPESLINPIELAQEEEKAIETIKELETPKLERTQSVTENKGQAVLTTVGGEATKETTQEIKPPAEAVLTMEPSEVDITESVTKIEVQAELTTVAGEATKKTTLEIKPPVEAGLTMEPSELERTMSVAENEGQTELTTAASEITKENTPEITPPVEAGLTVETSELDGTVSVTESEGQAVFTTVAGEGTNETTLKTQPPAYEELTVEASELERTISVTKNEGQAVLTTVAGEATKETALEIKPTAEAGLTVEASELEKPMLVTENEGQAVFTTVAGEATKETTLEIKPTAEAGLTVENSELEKLMLVTENESQAVLITVAGEATKETTLEIKPTAEAGLTVEASELVEKEKIIVITIEDHKLTQEHSTEIENELKTELKTPPSTETTPREDPTHTEPSISLANEIESLSNNGTLTQMEPTEAPNELTEEVMPDIKNYSEAQPTEVAEVVSSQLQEDAEAKKLATDSGNQTESAVILIEPQVATKSTIQVEDPRAELQVPYSEEDAKTTLLKSIMEPEALVPRQSFDQPQIPQTDLDMKARDIVTPSLEETPITGAQKKEKADLAEHDENESVLGKEVSINIDLQIQNNQEEEKVVNFLRQGSVAISVPEPRCEVESNTLQPDVIELERNVETKVTTEVIFMETSVHEQASEGQQASKEILPQVSIVGNQSETESGTLEPDVVAQESVVETQVPAQVVIMETPIQDDAHNQQDIESQEATLAKVDREDPTRGPEEVPTFGIQKEADSGSSQNDSEVASTQTNEIQETTEGKLTIEATGETPPQASIVENVSETGSGTLQPDVVAQESVVETQIPAQVVIMEIPIQDDAYNQQDVESQEPTLEKVEKEDPTKGPEEGPTFGIQSEADSGSSQNDIELASTQTSVQLELQDLQAIEIPESPQEKLKNDDPEQTLPQVPIVESQTETVSGALQPDVVDLESVIETEIPADVDTSMDVPLQVTQDTEPDSTQSKLTKETNTNETREPEAHIQPAATELTIVAETHATPEAADPTVVIESQTSTNELMAKTEPENKTEKTQTVESETVVVVEAPAKSTVEDGSLKEDPQVPSDYKDEKAEICNLSVEVSTKASGVAESESPEVTENPTTQETLEKVTPSELFPPVAQDAVIQKATETQLTKDTDDCTLVAEVAEIESKAGATAVQSKTELSIHAHDPVTHAASESSKQGQLPELHVLSDIKGLNGGKEPSTEAVVERTLTLGITIEDEVSTQTGPEISETIATKCALDVLEKEAIGKDNIVAELSFSQAQEEALISAAPAESIASQTGAPCDAVEPTTQAELQNQQIITDETHASEEAHIVDIQRKTTLEALEDILPKFRHDKESQKEVEIKVAQPSTEEEVNLNAIEIKTLIEELPTEVQIEAKTEVEIPSETPASTESETIEVPIQTLPQIEQSSESETLLDVKTKCTAELPIPEGEAECKSHTVKATDNKLAIADVAHTQTEVIIGEASSPTDSNISKTAVEAEQISSAEEGTRTPQEDTTETPQKEETVIVIANEAEISKLGSITEPHMEDAAKPPISETRLELTLSQATEIVKTTNTERRPSIFEPDTSQHADNAPLPPIEACSIVEVTPIEVSTQAPLQVVPETQVTDTMRESKTDMTKPSVEDITNIVENQAQSEVSSVTIRSKEKPDTSQPIGSAFELESNTQTAAVQIYEEPPEHAEHKNPQSSDNNQYEKLGTDDAKKELDQNTPLPVALEKVSAEASAEPEPLISHTTEALISDTESELRPDAPQLENTATVVEALVEITSKGTESSKEADTQTSEAQNDIKPDATQFAEIQPTKALETPVKSNMKEEEKAVTIKSATEAPMHTQTPTEAGVPEVGQCKTDLEIPQPNSGNDVGIIEAQDQTTEPTQEVSKENCLESPQDSNSPKETEPSSTKQEENTVESPAPAEEMAVEVAKESQPCFSPSDEVNLATGGAEEPTETSKSYKPQISQSSDNETKPMAEEIVEKIPVQSEQPTGHGQAVAVDTAVLSEEVVEEVTPQKSTKISRAVEVVADPKIQASAEASVAETNKEPPSETPDLESTETVQVLETEVQVATPNSEDSQDSLPIDQGISISKEAQLEAVGLPIEQNVNASVDLAEAPPLVAQSETIADTPQSAGTDLAKEEDASVEAIPRNAGSPKEAEKITEVVAEATPQTSTEIPRAVPEEIGADAKVQASAEEPVPEIKSELLSETPKTVQVLETEVQTSAPNREDSKDISAIDQDTGILKEAPPQTVGISVEQVANASETQILAADPPIAAQSETNAGTPQSAGTDLAKEDVERGKVAEIQAPTEEICKATPAPAELEDTTGDKAVVDIDTQTSDKAFIEVNEECKSETPEPIKAEQAPEQTPLEELQIAEAKSTTTQPEISQMTEMPIPDTESENAVVDHVPASTLIIEVSMEVIGENAKAEKITEAEAQTKAESESEQPTGLGQAVAADVGIVSEEVVAKATLQTSTEIPRAVADEIVVEAKIQISTEEPVTKTKTELLSEKPDLENTETIQVLETQVQAAESTREDSEDALPIDQGVGVPIEAQTQTIGLSVEQMANPSVSQILAEDPLVAAQSETNADTPQSTGTDLGKEKDGSVEAIPRNAGSPKEAEEITEIETQTKAELAAQPTRLEQVVAAEAGVESEKVVAEATPQTSTELPQAVADEVVPDAKIEACAETTVADPNKELPSDTTDLESTETVQDLEAQVQAAESTGSNSKDALPIDQGANVPKQAQPQTVELSVEQVANASVSQNLAEEPLIAAENEAPQSAGTDLAKEKGQRGEVAETQASSNEICSAAPTPAESEFEETIVDKRVLDGNAETSDNAIDDTTQLQIFQTTEMPSTDTAVASEEVVAEVTEQKSLELPQPVAEAPVTETKTELLSEIPVLETTETVKVLETQVQATPPNKEYSKDVSAIDQGTGISKEAQPKTIGLSVEENSNESVFLPETPPIAAQSETNADTPQSAGTDLAKVEGSIQPKSQTPQSASIETKTPAGNITEDLPVHDEPVIKGTEGEKEVDLKNSTSTFIETPKPAETEQESVSETQAHQEEAVMEISSESEPEKQKRTEGVIVTTDTTQELAVTATTKTKDELQTDPSLPVNERSNETEPKILDEENGKGDETGALVEGVISDTNREDEAQTSGLDVDPQVISSVDAQVAINALIAESSTVTSPTLPQDTEDADQALAIETQAPDNITEFVENRVTIEEVCTHTEPPIPHSTEENKNIEDQAEAPMGKPIDAQADIQQPIETGHETAVETSVLSVSVAPELGDIVTQCSTKATQDEALLGISHLKCADNVLVVETETQRMTPANETVEVTIPNEPSSIDEKAEFPVIKIEPKIKEPHLPVKTQDLAEVLSVEVKSEASPVAPPYSDTEEAVAVSLSQIEESRESKAKALTEVAAEEIPAQSETRNITADEKVADANAETLADVSTENKGECDPLITQPAETELSTVAETHAPTAEIIKEADEKSEPDVVQLAEDEGVIDDKTQDKEITKKAENTTLATEVLEEQNESKSKSPKHTEVGQEVDAEANILPEEVAVEAASQSPAVSEEVFDVKIDPSAVEPENETQFAATPEAAEVVAIENVVQIQVSDPAATGGAPFDISPTLAQDTETTKESEPHITEPSVREKSVEFPVPAEDLSTEAQSEANRTTGIEVSQGEEEKSVQSNSQILQRTENKTEAPTEKVVEEVSVQAEPTIQEATQNAELTDMTSQLHPDTTQLQNIVQVENLNTTPTEEASKDNQNEAEDTITAETESTVTKIETRSEVQNPIGTGSETAMEPELLCEKLATEAKPQTSFPSAQSEVDENLMEPVFDTQVQPLLVTMERQITEKEVVVLEKVCTTDVSQEILQSPETQKEAELKITKSSIETKTDPVEIETLTNASGTDTLIEVKPDEQTETVSSTKLEEVAEVSIQSIPASKVEALTDETSKETNTPAISETINDKEDITNNAKILLEEVITETVVEAQVTPHVDEQHISAPSIDEKSNVIETQDLIEIPPADAQSNEELEPIPADEINLATVEHEKVDERPPDSASKSTVDDSTVTVHSQITTDFMAEGKSKAEPEDLESSEKETTPETQTAADQINEEAVAQAPAESLTRLKIEETLTKTCEKETLVEASQTLRSEEVIGETQDPEDETIAQVESKISQANEATITESQCEVPSDKAHIEDTVEGPALTGALTEVTPKDTLPQIPQDSENQLEADAEIAQAAEIKIVPAESGLPETECKAELSAPALSLTEPTIITQTEPSSDKTINPETLPDTSQSDDIGRIAGADTQDATETKVNEDTVPEVQISETATDGGVMDVEHGMPVEAFVAENPHEIKEDTPPSVESQLEIAAETAPKAADVANESFPESELKLQMAREVEGVIDIENQIPVEEPILEKQCESNPDITQSENIEEEIGTRDRLALDDKQDELHTLQTEEKENIKVNAVENTEKSSLTNEIEGPKKVIPIEVPLHPEGQINQTSQDEKVAEEINNELPEETPKAQSCAENTTPVESDTDTHVEVDTPIEEFVVDAVDETITETQQSGCPQETLKEENMEQSMESKKEAEFSLSHVAEELPPPIPETETKSELSDVKSLKEPESKITKASLEVEPEAMTEEMAAEAQSEIIPDTCQSVEIDRDIISEAQASTQGEATQIFNEPNAEPDTKITGLENQEPLVNIKSESKSDMPENFEEEVPVESIEVVSSSNVPQMLQTTLDESVIDTTTQALAETDLASNEQQMLSEGEKKYVDETQALVGTQIAEAEIVNASETHIPNETLVSVLQSPAVALDAETQSVDKDIPQAAESLTAIPTVASTSPEKQMPKTEIEGTVSAAHCEPLANESHKKTVADALLVEDQASVKVSATETKTELDKLEVPEIGCGVDLAAQTSIEEKVAEAPTEAPQTSNENPIDETQSEAEVDAIQRALDVEAQTSVEETVKDATIQPKITNETESEAKSDGLQQALDIEAQTSVEEVNKEVVTQTEVQPPDTIVNEDVSAQSLSEVAIMETECEPPITQSESQTLAEAVTCETPQTSTEKAAKEGTAPEDEKAINAITQTTPEALVTETKDEIKTDTLPAAETELSVVVQSPQSEVDENVIEIKTNITEVLVAETQHELETVLPKAPNSEQVNVIIAPAELVDESFSQLLQNIETQNDTEPQIKLTTGEDKPMGVNKQDVSHTAMIDAEHSFAPDTTQSEDVALSETQTTIEAVEVPIQSELQTQNINESEKSVDTESLVSKDVCIAGTQIEAKQDTAAITENLKEPFLATTESTNIQENVVEPETQSVTDVQAAPSLPEISHLLQNSKTANDTEPQIKQTTEEDKPMEVNAQELPQSAMMDVEAVVAADTPQPEDIILSETETPIEAVEAPTRAELQTQQIIDNEKSVDNESVVCAAGTQSEATDIQENIVEPETQTMTDVQTGPALPELSHLLQNTETPNDTELQIKQTTEENKPMEVNVQELPQSAMMNVEPAVAADTPQPEEVILSETETPIEAVEAPTRAELQTQQIIDNEKSVDTESLVCTAGTQSEAKQDKAILNESEKEPFLTTTESTNLEENIVEPETHTENEVQPAPSLPELVPETSSLKLETEEIITVNKPEELKSESVEADKLPLSKTEESLIKTDKENDLAPALLTNKKLVPSMVDISEGSTEKSLTEALPNEVETTESCEVVRLAAETVKTTGGATVESNTTEGLDKISVENVALTAATTDATISKEVSSSVNNVDNTASSGMVFIEPLRKFIRPMTKRLCRQSHVVDTTSSDDDYSQRTISHLTTMCQNFIKDKRLLAALEKQRRQTEIMQNFLRSIDSLETEFDYEQHHTQCLLPEQTFILSTAPPPPPIDDDSTTDSYLAKALSDCKFNFLNDILFSDQLSTDSNHTDGSMPTTVESFLPDYNYNEQDLSNTNTFNNTTSINLTSLTNGTYLSLSPSNSFNISTNSNNQVQHFINNITKHKEEESINSEEDDDDDDVVPLRHFVPGSIAEREYKKWHNAVEMPNNPYAPEALKRRISGSQERFIDLPNINASTEKLPISLAETSKAETDAVDEIDYKRYSRDYYINDDKSAKNSPKHQSITKDSSRSSASASVSGEPATDITINEGTLEANETQQQVIEKPIEPHPTLYQALPAHVVEENASIETLSNQSMQSVNTTTSDDSDTVRIYDFKKQQTIIVRNPSKASAAGSIESLPADPCEPTLLTNATISTSIEDSPPNSLQARRPTDFPQEMTSSTSSVATVRTPITPTRGSTPMAFKFLQPKRKLIEPSQILSVDEGADALTISPPVEKAVVEEEVAQVMPSVKALAQAFLLSSSTKTTPAEKRWRKGVHSMPPAADKVNVKQEAMRKSETRLSVAEVAEDATITSDLSSLEADSTASRDHSTTKSPAVLAPGSPPSPSGSPSSGRTANAEGSKSTTTNALRRVSMLKSNIAFFENLKFK